MPNRTHRTVSLLVAGALLAGPGLALAQDDANDAPAPAPAPAPGLTGGYEDGRFSVASTDDRFSLSPSLLMQFRYILNYRDGGVGGDPDRSRTRDGLELTRVRVGADGHLYTNDLTYNVILASDPDLSVTAPAIGGGFNVLDAYVSWHGLADLTITAGQFREPLFREFSVGAGNQLAVERSLADTFIGGSSIGRVQGVSASWHDGGPLRGILALHEGARSNNTAYDVTPGGAGPSLRAEYMLIGDDWAGYEDFRAGNDEILVVGGGFNWQRFDNADILYHTVDVQWNNPADIFGLGVFAALLGRYDDVDNMDSQYQLGLLAQAGYQLDDRIEVFGRYSVVCQDTDGNPMTADVHEVTVGANYYFAGPHAKVSADLNWLPRGADNMASPAQGILAHNTDDDQIMLRVQLQLAH